MSTRANIIIKDEREQLLFYRHSDGYPEETMKTLNIFLDWLRKDKIRNNVEQASGWLVILGAMEYNTVPKFQTGEPVFKTKYGDIETFKEPEDWKVGTYEPATEIHGDIEYLYTIDLIDQSITIKKV